MSRIGRMIMIGTVAAGMVGGVAVAWTSPQEPSRLEEPPAMPELKRAQTTPITAEEPRDEPAVRLNWITPSEPRANRAEQYILNVTNSGTQPVQKVVVQVRVPNGVAVSESEQATCITAGVVLWELGTMQPRDRKQLKLKLNSPVRGELPLRAWVTFTGSTAANVIVREPKLVLALDAPESVEVGEEFRVKYRVMNDGDGTAERVILTVDAPKELTVRHTEAADSVVDLAPGRSHDGTTVQRAGSPGELVYTVTTSCVEGPKVTATARVKVTAPKLEVKVEGPSELGLNRSGKFIATVTNSGTSTAEGVSVRYEPGAGISPPPSSPVSLYTAAATDPLIALLGSLKPGESKSFAFEGTAVRPGDSIARFTVGDKRGGNAAAECRTVVKGVPGIRMELVDSVDPVKKGDETVYEIRVSNTGTDTDRNLRLQCELPEGMTLVTASGPVEYRERAAVDYLGVSGRINNRGTVTFAPVRELAPKSELVFRVKVHVARTGNLRFKTTLVSDHLTTPVTKEESTTAYGE